jgi:hypothetical protein
LPGAQNALLGPRNAFNGFLQRFATFLQAQTQQQIEHPLAV